MLVLEALEHAAGARRAHPGRDRRLRRQLRRLPHDAAVARTARAPPSAWRRRCTTPASTPDAVGYVNAHGTGTPVQRRGRDGGDQARLRRARRAPRGELDEVDDRPPARRRRRRRGHLHRAGGRARHPPAHHQPGRPRSGLRPRLRAAHARARPPSRSRSRTPSGSAARTSPWPSAGPTDARLAARAAAALRRRQGRRRQDHGRRPRWRCCWRAADGARSRWRWTRRVGLPTLLGADGAARRRRVRSRPTCTCSRSTGAAALEEYLGLVIPVKRLLHTVFSSRIYQYFVAAAPGLKELMTVGKIWYEATRQDGGATGVGRDRGRRAGDRAQPAVPAHAAGGARYLRRGPGAARGREDRRPAAGRRDHRRSPRDAGRGDAGGGDARDLRPAARAARACRSAGWWSTGCTAGASRPR